MILAIDQGTTGTTCLVVGDGPEVLGRGYRAIEQHFPRPGWVEHDPEDIWSSVLAAAEEALATASLRPLDLTAVGITNQRETTIVWDRNSGRPVEPAIVWQDRRTAERCRALPAELIRSRTGLLPDPYFSASKLEWILRDRSTRGLAFGTVDSWLAWRLTRGDVHVTDETNAARTLLVSLETLDWDDELLALFSVPREVLPEIRRSSEIVGEASLLGATVPLAGIAGDQQAALFGQTCFQPGQSKATYGTGSFVLVHAGHDATGPIPDGLLRTAACRGPDEAPNYALEGSVFVTGAALQWLRDGLGLITDAAESEELARSLDGNEGVYFVPALVGLGAPYWAPDARGLICGLTRGTRRAHIVRAALEAIAYQTQDVLARMAPRPKVVRADGGATANRFLMQFQADIAGIPLEVAAERETTALGAAMLAGLATGRWHDRDELAAAWQPAARYEPQRADDDVDELLAGWHAALDRTLT